MKNLIIRFSHNYPKLWGQQSAVLIKLIIVKADSLSPELIEYDTRTSTGEYYELPKKGFLLQLIFIGNRGIPFCTLRPFNAYKEKYYLNNVGKEFEVEIN